MFRYQVCIVVLAAAGVSIATFGLALSAHAADVKLGTDAGALVFDPDTVTIKAGESVTWTNNAGATPQLQNSRACCMVLHLLPCTPESKPSCGSADCGCVFHLAGFPHNIVFDEDAIPVRSAARCMPICPEASQSLPAGCDATLPLASQSI